MVTGAGAPSLARWALLVAVLGAAVAIGPRLPPSLLPMISVGWLIGAALAGFGLLRLVRRRAGTGVAVGGLVTAAGAVAVLWGIPWGGTLGTFLPCRRDWGWLPSWLLRSSPTRSASATLGAVRVKVCYGSPRARGRKMLGGPAVPYGQLWRTGANEPTTIRASGPIAVAGISVPGGMTSLYTVPGPETWEVVVNAATTQWGIESEYPTGHELGRRVVPSTTGDRYHEALSVRIEPDSIEAGAAALVLRWENTELRIALAVPHPSPGSPPGKIQD